MGEVTFRFSRSEAARRFRALPGHEAWGALQSRTNGVTDELVLARVHRYSGSSDREPAFTLTTAEEPVRTLCTVTPQPVAAYSRAAYAVHDGAGRCAGRIVRGGSSPGIRRQWRIEDEGNRCSAVARKGNIRGWIAYWAFSPLWAVLAVVYLVGGDLHPGRSLWGKPQRARWRVRGGDGARKVGLDFHDGLYRADTGALDARLVYTQAVLYGVQVAAGERKSR
ncbi:hypothetical protein [Streptomyces sp. NPDC014733]|uniref:hypothetical protein n=1 Tax=Streptomyces sp. NPDC014733 TaxID=3364885 RepID=UPI0036F98768